MSLAGGIYIFRPERSDILELVYDLTQERDVLPDLSLVIVPVHPDDKISDMLFRPVAYIFLAPAEMKDIPFLLGDILSLHTVLRCAQYLPVSVDSECLASVGELHFVLVHRNDGKVVTINVEHIPGDQVLVVNPFSFPVAIPDSMVHGGVDFHNVKDLFHIYDAVSCFDLGTIHYQPWRTHKYKRLYPGYNLKR